MGEFIQSKSRRIIYLFLIVAVTSLAVTIILAKPSAAIMELTLSWTNEEPKVIYSQPIADVMVMTTCSGELRSSRVVGEIDAVNVCFSVGSGSNIKFGMYYKGNSYVPVVGSVHDNKMYKLIGVSCSIYTPCVYIPSADVLVTKQYFSSRFGQSIVLYNNFSKRIKKTIDASITISYDFDATSPDYVYSSDPMKTWTVGGYGASENGDWLAIEIREKGMYILNMHTRELRRVSKMTFNYFWGMTPTTEMTISNDGRHVAIMGANAYITVYDVNDSCGDVATNENIMIDTPLVKACQQAVINTEKFIPHFFEAFHPRFSSDGGELSFYAIGYQGDQREVVMATAAYEPLSLKFLALGDSFSSGEGETSDKFYQKGTNNPYEKCHLSTRSYPYLTAKILGLSDQYVKSVACSGATTNDVIGWTPDYQGQGDRLKTEPLAPQQKEYALTEARENFVPGRILQAIFVEQYQPKIITIGIGGNDVGFMEKLKACLSPETCEWVLTVEGREKTAVEIQGLFWTLLDTYTNLRRLSPQSTIYAVGYPKIINPNGSCGVPLGLMFDSIERRFMDEGIKYINQVIAAAAKKAGVHYIDIENSLGNQVLCGDGKQTAMNWVRSGDDAGISSNFNNIKVIGFESFHPNPTGQELISKVVAGAIADGAAAGACATTDTGCYNSVSIPWPSNYWLFGGVMHDYSFQHNVKFTSDQIGSINGKRKTINMPLGFFDIHSKVHVELHSYLIDLGYLTTDSQGALKADITLPSNVSDGYHTLHLYGISPTGERVDYYDVINTTPIPNNYISTVAPVVSTSKTIVSLSQAQVPTTIRNQDKDGYAPVIDSTNNSARSKEVLGESISLKQLIDTPGDFKLINFIYGVLGLFSLGIIIAIILKAKISNHGHSKNS